MAISGSRARELEQGLTGIEKKVYEALSSQTAMGAADVCGELKRATGTNNDLRIVDGCLHSLVDRGLARRVGAKFQREPIRERPVQLEVVKPAADVRSAESNVEAIKRVSGEIVERLDQIEGFAKALEDERKAAEQRNAKAAKLAELLKDFNG